MDFSLKGNFCKHFKTLRECFEVFISFNIDQCLSNMADKISKSLFYDEKLDVEKEKRQLDHFAIKCKLSEHGWQVPCEITIYIPNFDYRSILFNRTLVYSTCSNQLRRPLYTMMLLMTNRNENNKITISLFKTFKNFTMVSISCHRFLHFCLCILAFDRC